MTQKQNKMIFTSKVRRPERIMNHTKTAMTVMFAITGAGKILPPYVVYKAESLWNTWTEGGPPKTRYDRTKSGWFDEMYFSDWFDTIVIPWAQELNGHKVVVGDNLSSHFSSDIIQKCLDNDIRFVCLPANTTHLTQPLDVGVYGPMKTYWQQILTEWKLGPGKNLPALPKDVFPSLLKQLLEKMQPTLEKNIISAFGTTGIVPFDSNRVLRKLPNKDTVANVGCDATQSSSSNTVDSTISQVIIDMVKEMREKESNMKRKRKRKVNVTPRKSVSLEDSRHQMK